MRNRAEIKHEARGILSAARVNPLLMTAIVMAVGFVLDRILDLVQGGSLFYTFTYQRSYMQQYFLAISTGDFSGLEALVNSVPDMVGAASFFSVLVSLFMLILNAGYTLYCMGIRQGMEMPFSTLSEGLGVAGKLIWCWFQMTVKIFLWTLLFVIPGIIAIYRYRFAYYNILTDPSLTAGQAIRLSCLQTQGIKGALFVLDLSFFGWNILAQLTMGLLNIWLTPYMTLCDLAYFEDAQHRLGRSPYGNGSEPPSGNLPWEL